MDNSGRLSCILLFLIASVAVRECREYETDYVILGAGWTGITAARSLARFGQNNFIILEGAGRIGGRMRETRFGGKTVELGANWIHGTDGNPIYHLAKKYGLKMNVGYDYDDVIVRDDNGTDLTEAAERYSTVLEEVIEKCRKIQERKLQNSEPDITYRSALSMSGWLPKNDIMDMVEYAQFDFEYAAPPEQVSLKNSNFGKNYIRFKNEDAFVVDQRGFIHLLKSMKNEFMDENDERLHLGKVVKKIEYAPEGVLVTTDNGDVYRAKFAICTFSVGVLENNAVEFVPPLPFWKRDVINNFDMNYYLKIFVKFPNGTKRFWDSETLIYHVSHRRGYYSLVQNLEAKNLFPDGTNLLLVTVTGREAVHVTREPKARVITELNNVFRKMYGATAVDIEDIIVPTWIQDPLQFGMYSAWPTGVTTHTFDILRLPVGALYFAGEYTSKEYYGYIHGAFFEGKRVAAAVYKCRVQGACPRTYRSPQSRPAYYREIRR